MGLQPAHAASTTVPDVLGKTEANARLMLQGASLNISVTRRVDPNQPAGVVLQQDPSAGTQLLTNSTVTITVSSGGAAPTPPAPNPVVPTVGILPSFLGMTPNEASTEAGQHGFFKFQNLSFQAAPGTSASLPRSMRAIVDQTPAAGTPLPSVNFLTLHYGPRGSVTPSSTVPNLIGMTQSEAFAAARSAGIGLAMEGIQTFPVPVVPQRVTRQVPRAGSPIPMTQSMTVYLGTGGPSPTPPGPTPWPTPNVMVPNFIGMTSIEVQAHNRSLGLTLRMPMLPFGSTGHRVNWQSLSAGSQVARGTTISLAFDQGRPLVSPTSQLKDYTGWRIASAEADARALGLQVGAISMPARPGQPSHGASEWVVRQRPVAGTAISSGMSVTFTIGTQSDLNPGPNPNPTPPTGTVQVPFINGRNGASYGLALGFAGLTPSAQLIPANLSRVPTRTSPPEGTMVARGSTVQVFFN